MKKTSLFFLFSFFVIVFLAGCGVSNPSGSGFSASNVAPGNAALSMTVNFPKKPVSLPAGLMGLISPNTTTIEIHISGGSVYNSAAVIASTAIVAPGGGGPVTANIVLTNPATSVISVEIVAKDAAGTWLGEVRELNKPLTMGGNTPINATMVELNQGIDMIAMGIPATSRPVVYAPDGTAYTVNKVILQSTITASGTTAYSMIAETDKKTTGGATTLNLALTTASGAVAVRTDPFVTNGIITGTFAFSNVSIGAKDYIFTLDFSGLNNIPTLTIAQAPGGLAATATLNPIITQQWANNISPTTLVQMGGAKQGRLLVLSNTVTSLTGTANTTMTAGALDGVATTATFNQSAGMTTDGTNLYVAEWANHKIRQIVIATGTVSSLTGTANTTMLSGAADGAGVNATFFQPSGITTDGTNLYVSDTSNAKIRKIVIATGVVSSLTGTANTAMAPGFVDGAPATAKFNAPWGITTDGTNLYVADSANNRIRKIVIATGVVSTVAGSGIAGATDGASSTATFNTPYGITTDGTNLYVADVNNNKIRKIVIATGVVSTVAGTGAAGAVDGIGSSASFQLPYDITTDGTNLYVSDNWLNNRIRKIVIATGVVSTIAGNGTATAVDGIGTAATFNRPWGITTDGANLYVADWMNSKIRKIQ